jgi:hypothetical protein
MLKKFKQGSKKAIGGIGKALEVASGIGELAGGIASLVERSRPPKPDWGGPSETGDSFTRLMEKRSILPPWLLKR